jgi:hypothetical protein
MKIRISSFILLAGGAMLFACQSKEKSETALDATPQAEIVATVVEPDNYFSMALDDYANQKYENSAKNILLATDAMKQIASSVDPKRKAIIESSVSQLEDLASDVASNHVDGINQLNYFFAKAGLALASYTLTITDEEITNLAPQDAASFFSSVIIRMEKSAGYHKHELTESEKDIMSRASNLRDRLVKNDKVNEQEISTMVKELIGLLKEWEKEFAS